MGSLDRVKGPRLVKGGGPDEGSPRRSGGVAGAAGCSALAASGRLSISGGPVECPSPCGSASREPGRTI